MKKIILAVIAVMGFSFANAQGVKFGIKGALNVANITGDVENASSLVGFQAGALVEFKVSEKFAIQPELMYSTQGVKVDDSKTKLNYLNIPVMAKYYVAKSFSLEAGPQIGFLLSAKTDGYNVKDMIRSTDFGINVGAGYDFTEKIAVGLRYNGGLLNIIDTDGVENNSKVRNSVFSLSLDYKF